MIGSSIAWIARHPEVCDQLERRLRWRHWIQDMVMSAEVRRMRPLSRADAKRPKNAMLSPYEARIIARRVAVSKRLRQHALQDPHVPQHVLDHIRASLAYRAHAYAPQAGILYHNDALAKLYERLERFCQDIMAAHQTMQVLGAMGPDPVAERNARLRARGIMRPIR